MTIPQLTESRNPSMYHLRSSYDLIDTLTASANESSLHVLLTITNILDGAWITEKSLHNENIRPFITAIHTLFMREMMQKCIEKTLSDTIPMILDPRIRAIYNGSYLIELATPVIQWNVASGVDKTITKI